MTLLLLGLVLFLGIHSLSIVAPAQRNSMARRLGEWPFKGLYSVIAAIGLVLIIKGYGAARMDPVVLYTTPDWTSHITMLLVLIAFPMLIATYFPGKISSTLKHPMLVAVKAWALGHLLANGMLADVLLFGGFLAWAVADRISLKRRTPRAIPRLPATRFNDAIVVLVGLALYGVFAIWLHPAWIGVPVVG
ncbi:NnrU family protein [Halomonadaceae bacterium KBTZ08]